MTGLTPERFAEIEDIVKRWGHYQLFGPALTDLLAEVKRLQGEARHTATSNELITHASDCAIYNEPASPAGPCDCQAMTLVERVARALFACDVRGGRWEDAPDNWREAYMSKARAAIAALREPSEAMIQAMTFDWNDDAPGVSAIAAWQAAIDAALEEDQAVR